MRIATKKLFAAMTLAMASSYGVNSVAEQFAIEPSVAQKLHDKITESVGFLSEINVMPVDELKSEKIFGAAGTILGKRTDTTSNDRVPVDVTELTNKTYECHKVEYDTYITYARMDSWAKFPDFRERYAKWVRKAIAQAKLRVGWYGESAAAETDPVTNTMGEDVNIGWFQILRDFNAGAQLFTEGGTVGEIRIGAGGDFENLDSAVHACLQMIPEHLRDDLVVIVGSDLLAEAKGKLYKTQGQTPTEKERIESSDVTQTYAGLPAKSVPSFPARGLMITRLDNLSIYYQDTSMRRTVKDKPERDRVEDYQSVNECYVIENEEAAAAFEFKNVKIPNAAGNAWV